MTRPIRKSEAMIIVLFAVTALAPFGLADDDPLVPPTEFESAPAAVLHGAPDVMALAVPERGEHLFAAFYDGSVMALERTSRQPVRMVKCHDGPVSDMVVSISGELMVTAGWDGTVKTWSLPGFEPEETMSGHSGRVIAIALSADGRTIASCGIDKTIRIWSIDSEVERGALTAHDSIVRTVAFSPEGATLASGGDDGIVRLWNVETQNEVGTRIGHTGRVRDVTFSPDGNALASAGEDGQVLLWNVANADTAPKAVKHGAMIWSVAFLPRGSLIASGDADGTIQLWDYVTQQVTSSLNGHQDTVTSLSFSGDLKTLYSSSRDGTILAWSAKRPPHPALAAIEVDAGKVWAMAVSPRTSQIAVGGQKGFVRILDLTTGSQVAELKDQHPATIDCLEFSSDGSLLATGGWRSSEVIVSRTDDGTKQQSFTADDNIRAIAFSPDGSQILAGCEDHQLIIWDVASGELIRKFKAHAQPVYDVSFSPDGQMIATCSGNWNEAKPGQIKLWNAASLTEIARLEGHEVAVRSAVFNPDGSRLASVSEDGVIRIWDVAAQIEHMVLRNSSGARTLAWSPNGNLLAAGLHDGTTSVWDLLTGTVIRRFGGERDTFSVCFVADGSVLCGAGGEKQIILWDTSELIGDATVGRMTESVRKWVKEMP